MIKQELTSGKKLSSTGAREKELIQKAEENKQGYKDKYGAVMASDLQTDGYLNGYAWKCENKDIDENLKPYLNELEFD